MPKIANEESEYAERIANVLRELRHAAGWTLEEADQWIGVPAGKVGRWERGKFAPKAADLGKAYKAYEPFGAEMKWFLFPPAVVTINPVRERLRVLAAAGTSAAARAERRATSRRRRVAALRDDGPDTQSK